MSPSEWNARRDGATGGGDPGGAKQTESQGNTEDPEVQGEAGGSGDRGGDGDPEDHGGGQSN